jgi:hypothetical protein
MGCVPILCHHHIVKTFGDAVDDRNHLVGVFDRQGPAGQEAILYIDPIYSLT